MKEFCHVKNVENLEKHLTKENNLKHTHTPKYYVITHVYVASIFDKYAKIKKLWLQWMLGLGQLKYVVHRLSICSLVMPEGLLENQHAA